MSSTHQHDTTQEIEPSPFGFGEDSRNWFAVQTRPHHEKRVAQYLHAKSLQVYLPIHRCIHRWKNGVRAELELPLFPGYLFARVAFNERIRVLELPGVVGFAASPTCPTPISEDDLEHLRTAVEMLKAEPHPFLNIGDRVRIIAGPLHGMEGVLVRRKSALGIVLSIDLIMRSIVVEVSSGDIERIPR